ncbi:hypothetical protein Hsw_1349 [Hymenobacter swuensis DY53]|uniref:Uncharacterized protein n=1 Tax=Hymenobacter swuensis DY53 TaxID=1227739 RepID=W8EUS1_9BACT|nr:hypothetical protein Hsw_1349 [Hymenobacter swuensis DY53]
MRLSATPGGYKFFSDASHRASPFYAVATNAAQRFTNLFMGLLEIQFPTVRKYHEPLLKIPRSLPTGWPSTSIA